MDKFLSILGFSRKAGKLIHGYDAVVNSLKAKTAKLVIVASDISEKSEKNARFESEKHKAEIIKVNYTMEEIGLAVGKKAVVFAVTDLNFADGLKNTQINPFEKG